MGRTTEIQGMLEIDHDRGVIYFHVGKKDFIDNERFEAAVIATAINYGEDSPEFARIMNELKKIKRFNMQNGVATALRLGGLPRPIPQLKDHGCLDVNVEHKWCDWGKDKVDG